MFPDTQRNWAPLRGASKGWRNQRERETEGCEHRKKGRAGDSRVVWNSLM